MVFSDVLWCSWTVASWLGTLSMNSDAIVRAFQVGNSTDPHSADPYRSIYLGSSRVPGSDILGI